MKLRTRYTQRYPTALGLVLDISLFEGSGLIAHDMSGKGNHGTVSGAAWTVGEKGVCLDFDGSNDYVVVLDADSLDFTTAITQEGMTNVSSSIVLGSFLNKEQAYRMVLFYANGNIYSMLKVQPGWTGVGPYAGGYDFGAWYSWSVIYDSTSENFAVYSNGSNILSQNHAGWGELVPSATDLYIGSTTPLVDPYKGLAKSIRLYNTRLSVEKIKRRHEQPNKDYCRGS